MTGGSAGLQMTFVLLPVAVAAAFVAAVAWSGSRSALTPAAVRRRTLVAAVLTAAWLAVTVSLASRGRVSFVGTPPTMLLLIAATLAVGLSVGLSTLGRQLATGLPLVALVGVQGFRFPLEVWGLHRAYEEGLMPVQMSYSGYNFDVVTGVSALVLAAMLATGRRPLGLVRAWNWMGLALLVNVVTIAILSAPLPFRTFHAPPANVWITEAPYVWLPTVLVLAALLGHILVFRATAAASRGRAGNADDHR